MPEYNVSVENLSKSFNTKEVLKGLSLSLSPGSVFGLVGLNGAGKTTLIRILLGLLQADKGKSTVLGMNPADHERNLYRRVGIVLEHNGFFGNLSVRNNLSFFAEARGMAKQKMEEYFVRYWADTAIGRDTKKVKFFSRGQKMQCALCRAFLGSPEVFFLDEPVVALDLEAYDQFCSMVRTAQSQGATIIISSHQLEAIEDLCTSVGILEQGAVEILESFSQERNEELWCIRTDNNEKFKASLEQIIGKPVHNEDGLLRFSFSEAADQVIPKIVSQLVSQGAAIYEVRPEDRSFRKSIRQYYEKSV